MSTIMSLSLRCGGQSTLSLKQCKAVTISRRLSSKKRQRTIQRPLRRKGVTHGVVASFDFTLKSPTVRDVQEVNRDKRDPDRIRRVVLKISGEALGGVKQHGIDQKVLLSVAQQIAACNKEGYQIAVVVGGGNFFRGVDAFEGIDRVTADHVGMLATCMNGACLHSMLESLGIQARLQTAIEMREVAEPYVRRKAIDHLEKGRVVVFGAGTGSPFFTTDMAAAVRAAELNADEVLKATKVDGIYSEDPKMHPYAVRFDRLSYDQAMEHKIGVMDRSALLFCSEQSIPIRVFSLIHPSHIQAAIKGDPSVGSVIQDADDKSYSRMEKTNDASVNNSRWSNERVSPISLVSSELNSM